MDITPLLQLSRFGWVTPILTKSRKALHVEKTNLNRSVPSYVRSALQDKRHQMQGPRAKGNRAKAKDFPLGSFGSSGL